MGTGQTNPIAMARILLTMALPKLAVFLKFPILDEESTSFFVDVIRQTLAHRRKTKERRNDFIDLTLDALKDDIDKEVEDDQFEKDAQVSGGQKKKYTEEEMELYLVSNLFILFIAGFDTTSTTLAVCSYFLAKHQDIQERLYNEIIDKFDDISTDDLDYNFVSNLPYLDMVVNETLRHWPLTFIERQCTKPYKVPGTDFTIPEGMLVQIPNGSIMKDPEIFENPEEFNPENFAPDVKSKRNPYTFLAFGQGPRNCIGMRFALLSLKLCLIRMLKEFKLKPCSKTLSKLELNPMTTTAAPKGGVILQFEKR